VRRSLLFGLVGLAILSLPQVLLAHGSVVRNYAEVFAEGPNTPVVWSYKYNTTQVHRRVCVHVTVQKRPGGGGTWAHLESSRKCDRKVSGIKLTNFVSHKCSKDYRVVGRGVSYGPESGAHLEASDTSNILQNTC
jgi:hypothetical protein